MNRFLYFGLLLIVGHSIANCRSESECCSISGLVTDDHGSVSQAVVSASQMCTTTNDDGSFVLEGIPSGTQVLGVKKEYDEDNVAKLFKQVKVGGRKNVGTLMLSSLDNNILTDGDFEDLDVLAKHWEQQGDGTVTHQNTEAGEGEWALYIENSDGMDTLLERVTPIELAAGVNYDLSAMLKVSGYNTNMGPVTVALGPEGKKSTVTLPTCHLEAEGPTQGQTLEIDWHLVNASFLATDTGPLILTIYSPIQKLWVDRLVLVPMDPVYDCSTPPDGGSGICDYSPLVEEVTVSSAEDLELVKGRAVIDGHLVIERSDLRDLSGLECLERVGTLYIGDNNSLIRLTGIENLKYINGLARDCYPANVGFSRNPLLESVAELKNITGVIGGLGFRDCDSITSLEGVENITSLSSGLNIADNDQLVSIAALGNLTSVGGDLEIICNDSLTDLTGLESLASFGTIAPYFPTMYIDDNASLTNLRALAQLSEFRGDLFIRNNPVLPTCEAEWLRDRLIGLGWEGRTIIEGNDDSGTCPP